MPETINQRAVYVLNKKGRNYRITKIERVPLRLLETGENVVRYERFLQPVHTEKSLQGFIKIKSRMKRSKFSYMGKIFDFDDGKLPFIKTWEANLGRYSTFGPGGW